jgi:DNA-binding transcriptional ArsR family regulator
MQGNLPPARINAVCRALSHPRRRRVLRTLDGSVPPVSLETLTIEIVEMGRDDADDPGPTRSSATVDLHHHHLPHLEDAGLITYDPVKKEVIAWAGCPLGPTHDEPPVSALTGLFDGRPNEGNAEPAG